jgi:hypothetical protein
MTCLISITSVPSTLYTLTIPYFLSYLNKTFCFAERTLLERKEKDDTHDYPRKRRQSQSRSRSPPRKSQEGAGTQSQQRPVSW